MHIKLNETREVYPSRGVK